jgi:hypothetical protein
MKTPGKEESLAFVQRDFLEYLTRGRAFFGASFIGAILLLHNFGTQRNRISALGGW